MWSRLPNCRRKQEWRLRCEVETEAIYGCSARASLGVDKASFHIRRLRTDLLAPLPEVRLAEQTPTIGHSEVRFANAAPLWLPHDVDVNIQFKEHLASRASDLGSRVTDQTFCNIHHYSNYLLYRVSTKIGVPH